MRYPKELFIYVVDKLNDGTPCFGAVPDINEISEDQAGEKIAIYTLNRQMTFKVKRELT